MTSSQPFNQSTTAQRVVTIFDPTLDMPQHRWVNLNNEFQSLSYQCQVEIWELAKRIYTNPEATT